MLYTLHVASENLPGNANTTGDIFSSTPPAADKRVRYGADELQFADVRIPAGHGPHPIVLFIHGGYWRAKYDLVHTGHLCQALKRSGIATWNVEYRRVGNPGGGWPGTFEDIRSAYRYLREPHKKDEVPALDVENLCVVGHSAGGQLAMCLPAYEKTISRVLALAGVLDLRRGWNLHLSNDAVAEYLGGSPTEVPDHYREASPIDKPVPHAVQKLIHGTADDSVPYEISQNYVERKKMMGENVELITLPGVGHFELIDPGSAVWNKVQQTIVKLTRK